MIFIVNCEWTDWQIGQCSVTCGGGTRRNTRSKKVEEKNGGMCTGDLTAQEDCNDQSCPGNIYSYLKTIFMTKEIDLVIQHEIVYNL